MPAPSAALAGPFQDFLESRSNDFTTFEERKADVTKECHAFAAEEGEEGLHGRAKGQDC